ncbi:hypothetical protein [Ammoniphilus sp. YIM 78166]|uniref:hypothetical protein n=1 Tax=Ammoniphilus sp. YIM 78166 TaxID=1644106 RepID=UPI00143154D3|nr:hypothetical protein [Ammoniphilus sp. YIM 78166]
MHKKRRLFASSQSKITSSMAGITGLGGPTHFSGAWVLDLGVPPPELGGPNRIGRAYLESLPV